MPADHVVMVVAGGGQGVEVAATLERVPLHDTRVVQRLEVAVHGDEVERAIASLFVNLFGAEGAGGFGQDLEHR